MQNVATTPPLREVTQSEFYRVVGPLDVVVSATTAESKVSFRLRNGQDVGETIGHGEKTKYYLISK